jgi:hypothetical protein
VIVVGVLLCSGIAGAFNAAIPMLLFLISLVIVIGLILLRIIRTKYAKPNLLKFQSFVERVLREAENSNTRGIGPEAIGQEAEQAAAERPLPADQFR